jgi:hypothetical protein
MYLDLSICFDECCITLKLDGFSDDTNCLTWILGDIEFDDTDEFLTERSVDAGCWFLHRRDPPRVCSTTFNVGETF